MPAPTPRPHFVPNAPEDRYRNDPNFAAFVDMVEHVLHQAQYTPSELREAVILAAIHYELRRVPVMRNYYMGMTVEDFLRRPHE